jgi:hypothetical protein
LAFSRYLLDLCENQLRNNPDSPAAVDAEDRIEAACNALTKGHDQSTYAWAFVVWQLKAAAEPGADHVSVVAKTIELEPRLLDHGKKLWAALDAWRDNHGKWEATLALLAAAGLYPNAERHTAEKPSELLRQRWNQFRRAGVPPAYRSPDYSEE